MDSNKIKRKRIFNINGGIGRCIAFTGVLRKYIDEHPDEDVYIVTGFPDVFYNFKGLKRVYPMNTPYIFEDLIKEGDYLEPEPYTMPEYYRDEEHISACFNKLVNGVLEEVKPIFYLSSEELRMAKEFAKSHNKPIALFQPYGSMGGLKNKPDMSKRSLRHDFAKKIADELAKNYEVYLIQTEFQIGIEGYKAIKAPLRQLISLIPNVAQVLGVDSFLQHAASAFDTKAHVFWTTTRRTNLGYEQHHNYHSNARDLHWSPIRMLANDLEQDYKNQDADVFDDSVLEHVFKNLGDIEAQKKKALEEHTPIESQQECNTCK